MIRLADIEATFRRTGPTVPNPPPRTAQHEYYEQQARIRETHESAKRRSSRPVDRNLPDGIEDLVPGDAAEKYNSLREAEKSLDTVMMRKRLDIHDALQGCQPKYGTLRIWISNTVENQPWQASALDHDAFDFTSNTEATFRVKIEGRLLDSADDSETPASEDQSSNANQDEQGDHTMDDAGTLSPQQTKTKTPPSSQDPRRKLSHFFKSITVDFDRPQSLQPDNFTRIQWTKPDLPPSIHAQSHTNSNSNDSQQLPKEADFDRLEFQRKGDENINITVNLVRDEQNPRYKLSPGLASLLDIEVADRKTVLMGIWEYVKLAGLQDENDGRSVRCDARLHEALGVEFFYFPNLVALAARGMFDAPPISLPYTIRVDKAFHQPTTANSPSDTNTTTTPPATIYDIPIPLPDPLSTTMESIKSSTIHLPTLQSLSALDTSLALAIQRLKHEKARHGFFTSLAEDPAGFVRRWVGSQARDRGVIEGGSVGIGGGNLGVGGEGVEGVWRRGGEGGVWGGKQAVEGVGGWLGRMDREGGVGIVGGGGGSSIGGVVKAKAGA